MGKRSKARRRQGDPLDGEGTGTSDEETAKKCPHLAKGLNLPALKKAISQGINLSECEECSKDTTICIASPDSSSPLDCVSPTIEPTIPSTQEPSSVATHEIDECNKEDAAGDEVDVSSQICLQCGHRGCGRNQHQHALAHYRTPHSSSHDLVVDSATWITWCYKCDDFVFCESARLTQAIDFIRKQSGLTGKPSKIPLGLKRSQSQFDTKEASVKGFPTTKNLSSDSKDKDVKGKENGHNELSCLPAVKGLTNLGNTCFFNSVMQVLSQTHWLTQMLDLEIREGHVVKFLGSDCGPSYSSSCSTLSEIDNCDSGVGSLLEGENHDDFLVAEPISVMLSPGKPLTLTLASFLKEMHCPAASGGANKRRQSSSVVTPSSLFNQISKRSPQFRGFQQQDAHELLRHLLDGIRTEEITRRRHAIMNHFNLPANMVKNQPVEVDPLLKRKLKVYGKESAHTFVDQLFGGQLISTVICETCHQSYQILEPFMDLSLPVSEDKSPPIGNKRRGGGGSESVACLAPSSPVPLSKHQLKKGRKVGRKGKGRMKEENKDSTVDDENPVSSTPLEENTDGVPETERASPTSSNKEDEGIGEEESVSSASSERGDDVDDEEGGGDVEDNNEEQDSKETEDLASKLEKVHIDTIDEEDSISQHTTELATPPSITLKKVRAEWTAKSLCALAVRYQATPQECSVQSCLNLFTAPELLTGSNKYGCENCTQRKAAAALAEGTANVGDKTPTVYSVASKQLLIFAPPALLTLHLKRFTHSGATLRKAQKHVDFPVLLDLAPFCSAASAGVSTVPTGHKKIMYSLYGVIEHSGRLSQGHYTAFVKARPVAAESVTKFLQQLPMQTDDMYRLRDQLSARLLAEAATSHSSPTEDPASDNDHLSSEGVWYHCSDSHVMPVSEDKVLRSQAFLLFYERVL